MRSGLVATTAGTRCRASYADGVHLNRRGGTILAGLVQNFLDS